MIVFALRHADRTSADDLSPAGQERANCLRECWLTVASVSSFEAMQCGPPALSNP